MMCLRVWPVLLTALCLTPPSAVAASLMVSGYVSGTSGTVQAIDSGPTVLNPATDGQTMSKSGSAGPTSGLLFTHTYFEGTAAFGDVGLQLGGVASCFGGCGTLFIHGDMTAYASDRLLITGATDGILRLTSSLHGSFAAPDSMPDVITMNYILSSLTAGGLASNTTLGGGNGGIYDGLVAISGGNGGIYDGVKPLDMPFRGGSVGITYKVVGQFNKLIGSGSSLAIDATFTGSAHLGNLQILDVDGNPLQGATVTSESGYDYTQPLPLSTVPEPSTFILLGIGLAGIVAKRRSPRETLS
jgi:hypothetical protein